jgi:DNA-binding transcriptional ArsR family regulator
MRPLVHPAIEEVSVEAILHALSDPVRVAIFAEIVGQECTQKCSSFLPVSGEAIPKSTLSQHFRILREAGLIRGERRGVEMHNVSRYVEVEELYPGLLAAIGQAHSLQVAREARARKKSAKSRAK